MSNEQQPTNPPSHAVQLAKMWAQVPPEHLEVALKALEPELQREHEHRLAVLQQHERRMIRDHLRYMCGLGAGFAVAVGMLASAVFVGINGQFWLAALLTGPSMLALAKLFVIRRVDTEDARQVGRTQQGTLAGASADPARATI